MRSLILTVVGVMLMVPHASGDAPAPTAKRENGQAPVEWPFVLSPGKWKVTFANGVTETCEIRRDGTVSVVEPLRSSTGKLEVNSLSALIRYADDRLERWTAVGQSFVVEHWFPASRLPVATAVLGIAERVADARLQKEYVVHEWGTFSSFSGSDGAYLKFYPNDRDLPGFVHNIQGYIKGGLPDTFVSLETPVLYFYSDRDRTASVRVGFRRGRITDWYPETSRPPFENLQWDNIKIVAAGRARLPGEGGAGRYFQARDTDSALLQTSEPGKSENEKFLFYRGVGNFDLPFSVRALGSSAFAIKNTADSAVPGLFLVRVQSQKVYFEPSGNLAPGAEVRLRESTSATTAEKLGDAVARLLIEQGLYEKEARAMVKTWSADWFGQDGVRVLYVLPKPLTTELLPLTIDPKPDQLVRVLIGRHDILTPEREREIDALVKQFTGPSNEESKTANKLLDQLGRYRWPAQTAAAARLQAQAGAQSRR
jgi:hypothetical protein